MNCCDAEELSSTEKVTFEGAGVEVRVAASKTCMFAEWKVMSVTMVNSGSWEGPDEKKERLSVSQMLSSR